MKIYRLNDTETNILYYGSNEICIADQYLKLLNNPDTVKKLSSKELNKYINLIINARTNGLFISKLSRFILKTSSGFENYRFINETEICEVN